MYYVHCRSIYKYQKKQQNQKIKEESSCKKDSRRDMFEFG